MMRDVEHKPFSNPLQTQLRNDRQEIEQNTKLLVEADKTRNYYKVEKPEYDNLVKKEIHKSYKKATEDEMKEANDEQINIIKDLDLTDRNIFKTTKQEANIKLKDHKENFNTNPTTRLINPSKPETGKISKKILSRIIYELRLKTKYKSWKNSDSVINWFKKIQNKGKSTFIAFDIKDFYNSISEELFSDALKWAESKTDISKEEEDIIRKTKKSFLFYDKTAYRKKGQPFNVTMGSYDGAETCELVGLYLLSKLEDLGLNIGLYRDDGLAASDLPPQEVERMKKKICSLFRKHGLELSVEANSPVVNFLDITLDLSNGEYRPYMKPNQTIKYVSKLSNHPPAVTKNLPKNINNRLSKISINESVFNAAAPPYQAALKESGYNFKLKFDPEASKQHQETSKKRTRKRKVIWFNPPWSCDVKTNIGKKYLEIVKSTFHKKHPLYKLCNRNTMKISYSCLPNIKSDISKHNIKIQKSNENIPPHCNCRDKSSCPVPGRCATTNVVYQATVTREDQGTSTTYTGLASNFKERWSSHKTSFKYERYRHSTKLSGYIWSLKDQNIPYNIRWDFLGRASSFNPATSKCRLCLLEKFFILYHPDKAALNQRSELFSQCLHKRKNLLYNE